MQATSQWGTLAERSYGGISVALDYRYVRDDLFSNRAEVRVRVKSASDDFTIYPDPSQALTAYHHPYAVRDRYLSSGRLDTAGVSS